jgi:hypothetical protein
LLSKLKIQLNDKSPYEAKKFRDIKGISLLMFQNLFPKIRALIEPNEASAGLRKVAYPNSASPSQKAESHKSSSNLQIHTPKIKDTRGK